MAKYHVNPATGAVSRCFALLQPCPFGGRLEHYDTAEDAARAFEKVMSGQTWVTVHKTVAQAEPVGKLLHGEDEIMALFPSTDGEKNRRDGESFRSGRKDAFRALYASLPLDQRIALDVYSLEDHALKINEILRAKDTERQLVQSPYLPAVTGLDSFIAANPSAEPEFVYRGVPLTSQLERKTVLEELQRLSVGDRLVFDAYVSATPSFTNAVDFAGGPGGLIYEIYSRSGAFINESVEELLLPRAQAFVFVGVEECGGPYDYVSIKLIESDLLSHE